MNQFEYPHITGSTTQERQEQIIRYLRSLVEQLNMERKESYAEH
jgi:hypothetical protein